MDIQQFIKQASEGNAVQAKETLENILSARAFESLDVKKQEIARSLYNNGEEIEVQDTADTPMEDELLTQEEFDALSEEDQELYLEQLEQLDEVSMKLATKVNRMRRGESMDNSIRGDRDRSFDSSKSHTNTDGKYRSGDTTKSGYSKSVVSARAWFYRVR